MGVLLYYFRSEVFSATLYRSILCYMVVSLTRSIPFMIKAVLLTKISSDIIRSGIISGIEILTQSNFHLRAITSDNDPTNVSCLVSY